MAQPQEDAGKEELKAQVEDQAKQEDGSRGKKRREVERSLLTKRRKLLREPCSPMQSIRQKLEEGTRKRQEEREKLDSIYDENVQNMFKEWDRSVERNEAWFLKQEEIYQNIKAAHQEFLKNMAWIQKDEQEFIANETKEFIAEMTEVFGNGAQVQDPDNTGKNPN